jgi:hypothetical protein
LARRKEIYVMGADGSNSDCLGNPADDLEPARPPDGVRNAFRSDRAGPAGIDVIHMMAAG